MEEEAQKLRDWFEEMQSKKQKSALKSRNYRQDFNQSLGITLVK